ncbi:MAG: peptidoglycan DD-metalloendopeptidase family protein [Tissierellia bacterium]|nr:peptidoglycan DD-metalloendopeptidase family protein [Tissierellia bacterium]
MLKNKFFKQSLSLGILSLSLLMPVGVLAQADRPVDKPQEIVDNIDQPVSLYLQGDYFCSFPNQEEAETFEEKLRTYYQAKDKEVLSIEVDFDQELEIKKGGRKNYLSADQALEALMEGGQRLAYTILEKDQTLEDLAQLYQMTPEEVLDLNPHLDPQELLSQGQVIQVYEAVPMVKAQVQETFREEVLIPFERIQTEDPNLPIGQSRIVQEGQNGIKEITSKRLRIGDQVLSQYVLSERITQEANQEIVAIGTKETLATGSFINPTTGYLSSPFGPRWGRFHYGIDIANGVGTPILAADGGKVIRAEYAGSYGNLIVIDHGNGYESRYAHCSAFDVSVGQEVSQGQTIGRMGSTGRSTGSHLHFEVRDHGTALNPLNFVSY